MTDILRACLWMSGTIAAFTSMAIAGRAISFELDTFEIMLFRSLFGICVVLAIAWYAGTLHQITRRHLDLHGIRNLGHFAGQNLWFYAITVVPLAQVFAMEFTMPIWAIFLAPFVLNERITRVGLIGALVAFVGILVVTRPGSAPLSFGLVAAALAAIGFAVSAVYTRLLTRTETITCILFYLTTMQAVFGLIMAGYDRDIAVPSAGTLPGLIVIGCAGLLGHFCLTKALSLAPASVVMPIDFARLPVIAVVGVLLYSEPLDPLLILGAALIFAGNYLNLTLGQRAKP